MIHPAKLMKRRAAVGAVLALVSSAGCLAGVLAATRMREAALRRELDLRPVLQRVQQVTAPDGVNIPPGAYQQALQESVAHRSDILAAAVVDDDGTIVATYPENPKQANNSVVAPLPGAHYRIPGLTADQPNWDGIYPFLRPDDPANNTFGPVGRPGGGNSTPVNLDDPQVEARFRDLMLGVLGSEAPPGPPGRPVLVGHLITARLPQPANSSGLALLVLPRPDRASYELATYYLRPAFLISALASLVLFCLMLPWWVYLDARPRTEKAVPLAVFVLLTNFLGWLTYLVIRPEAERLCMSCGTLMEPSYRCCPQCGWSSQARCRQCGRPTRPDWRFCPYCEAPRAETELAAARTAARREVEGASG